MLWMLLVLSGCGAVKKAVNLSTSYEEHYESSEEQLKDKVLTERWQAKGCPDER